MSLVLEPVMLFKTQAVRRDLRESSRSPRFLILLISNKLSDCGWEGGCACNCFIRSKPECC